LNESSDVTIAAVGDFMIQRRAAAEDIERVRELLGDASITVANLDTVLSGAGQPVPKYSNLRGPRGAVDDLRDMGFHIVTLANNHTMDYGPEGLLDMRQALIEAGLQPVGGGKDLATALAPVEIAIGDRTVAIISLACTLPPNASAGPSRPGVAPVTMHQAYPLEASLAAEQPGSAQIVKTWLDEAELQRACEQVIAAKSRADIVVVAVHWGVPALWRTPLQPRVLESQRTLGRALIDAGAGAVVGNHAHELHEIEFHQERPIAYSLGNFWIDSLPSRTWMGRETILLRLAFPGSGVPEVHALPLLLNEHGFPHHDPELRSLTLLESISDGVRFHPLPDGRWFRLG
jgi:poly-gamma-glutamate synthesis protein (capsule biosynthesis protein)